MALCKRKIAYLMLIWKVIKSKSLIETEKKRLFKDTSLQILISIMIHSLARDRKKREGKDES